MRLEVVPTPSSAHIDPAISDHISAFFPTLILADISLKLGATVPVQSHSASMTYSKMTWMERVASWGVLQPHLTELEAVQWKDKMVFKLICEDP
jgi:hypothetical protein